MFMKNALGKVLAHFFIKPFFFYNYPLRSSVFIPFIAR